MAKRASPQNTRFEYLYRDASNYKAFGEVVFKGAHTAQHVERLRAAFESGEHFIAAQIQVPSVRFEDTGAFARNEDDHCWHEFGGLVADDAAPTDERQRTIEQFVADVERARIHGWEVWDPKVPIGELLDIAREFL